MANIKIGGTVAARGAAGDGGNVSELGAVSPGSQQQWFSRNCDVDNWMVRWHALPPPKKPHTQTHPQKKLAVEPCWWSPLCHSQSLTQAPDAHPNPDPRRSEAVSCSLQGGLDQPTIHPTLLVTFAS